MGLQRFLASSRTRTILLVLAALLVGALATAAPVHGVPPASGGGSTVLIASGSTSLSPGETATVVSNAAVSAYRTVRVVAEADSQVTYEVLSGAMRITAVGTSRYSEAFEVPGLSLSLKVIESSATTQSVTWAIYGRS
jgi:hypothetical protein